MNAVRTSLAEGTTMQPVSGGRLVLGLAVGLAVLGLPSPGRAADSEKVKFETVDRVELQGTWYPSTKGRKAPCVLMLHPVGGNSQQEGWDDLARALQKAGYAVLTFDFRGHGDSTNVDTQVFWQDPINQRLKGYRAAKPKATISVKDFTNLYHYATLVNDIAAAKRFLEQKNNSGECNAAVTVLIGAESGAALGAIWLATEWKRRRLAVGELTVTASNRLEGEDIACCVWLSPDGNLGRYKVGLSNAFREPRVREKVPMAFLHGEQDTRSANLSRDLLGYLRPEGKIKKLTIRQAVPGSGKLSGRELLGKKSLETEGAILKYLNTVMEERVGAGWSMRELERNPLFPVPYQHFLR
jgi:hypothetical protein